jgi:signal peptidase I
MTRFDEIGGPFGAEGPKRPAKPSAHFDPLFQPWHERKPEATADDDHLFAYEPVAAEQPAPVTYKYEPRAAPAYPDRYAPVYEERMTELQQRLREGTLTVPRGRHRWAVTLRELAETLLLAALLFLAVRASFQNFRVEGASMNPSLENGEYLIVNKLSYAEIDLGALDWLPFFDSGSNPMRQLWGSPERGDVVVFESPTNTDRDFIKRVIGLPGDTVDIRPDTGEVMVNGQVLQEDYIQGRTSCGEQCVYHIPPAGTPAAQEECGSGECYFVMGDNRQNSSDSRQGWLVPRENIIGKTMITYWHRGGPNIGMAPNHSVSMAEESEPD